MKLNAPIIQYHHHVEDPRGSGALLERVAHESFAAVPVTQFYVDDRSSTSVVFVARFSYFRLSARAVRGGDSSKAVRRAATAVQWLVCLSGLPLERRSRFEWYRRGQ